MSDRIADFIKHAFNNEGNFVKLHKLKTQQNSKANSLERIAVFKGAITALSIMGIEHEVHQSFFLRIVKGKHKGHRHENHRD